ncbi:endonuclease [Ferrimonas sp. SCSIO 43195]|uniref:endonuclease n=1 Tax=Ferrimonas sp. SCSIO 43195 TaxID=2822844 RepID=UPI0020753097|nr:endonuclease [Ferrimonas sp. SCSIO 43195]USD39065.1 endonuclease [Ferrimonas sp. SCSIO 43195]
MTIKINAVAAATALVLGTLSTAANAELLITEYVEGGGFNKAIEISNLGTDTITLDGHYELAHHSVNSKGVAGEVQKLALTGTLQSNKSLIFINSGISGPYATKDTPETKALVAAIKANSTADNKVINFNGNDSVVLLKDGAVIDSIGQLGKPSKDAWTEGSFSTKDKTLRRKTSVTTGDTDTSDAYPGTGLSQWEVKEKDTLDGLGCPGEDACTSTATPGVLLITEYIEGTGAKERNRAIEISNVGGTAIDFSEAEYKLNMFWSGSDTNGKFQDLTGTLDAGASIVFYNSDADDALKKVGSSSATTYFDGDESLTLTKDGVVIDSFGKLGDAPEGGAWTDPNNANFSTQDKTLRRKASVTSGDSNATDNFPGTNNEWVVFDVNTADGLGCAGEEACSTTPVDPDPDAPCNNCADITAIKDPSTFNGDIYYSDVLTGNFNTPEELKNALSAIIAKDHVQLSYSQVWTVLTHADQDPGDATKVRLIYSDTPVAKNSNPGSWNREHVWAKSHGFPDEDQWGYTDAHHLRPANPNVNSTRNNYDFGECGDNGVEQSSKGAPGNCLDTTKGVWEPRDSVKGDVARMILYMDTRYQGTDTATTQMDDLVVVDHVTTGDEDKQPRIGTLCTLYAWNTLDPVDDFEKNRNNEVYKYQGNRNPFIDRPELVKEVYGAACGDDPTPTLEVEGEITAPETVTEGSAFTLDASALTAGEDKTLTFKWEQISGEEKTVVGTEAVLTLTAPMVDADSALKFTLTVSDGSLEASKVVNLPVTNVPLTLDVSFDGNIKLTEGDSTTITAVITDAPEGLTYSWKQVSGDAAKFTATGLKLDVTSPQVNISQALVFELTASSDDDSFKTTVSIDVENTEEAGWVKPDGAGSFGGFIALLLPLMWRRRRA